jgi:hypothetical protein
VADAATDAREALDRVEQDLTPGHGRLDLFGFIRGELLGPERQGVAAVGVELSHRFSPGWSAFGRGTVGVAWLGDERRAEVDVLAGIRGKW